MKIPYEAALDLTIESAVAYLDVWEEMMSPKKPGKKYRVLKKGEKPCPAQQ